MRQNLGLKVLQFLRAMPFSICSLEERLRQQVRRTGAPMNMHDKNFPEATIYGTAFIRLFSVLILVFFGASVHGQTTPEAQTSPTAVDQTPNVSTNVDEVSLDLVVHDKKHNAILDLKPEDFVVTDNGEPVKLTGFHLVGADAASRGHMVTLLFDSFHGAIAKSTQTIAEKILNVLPTAGYTIAVLDFKTRLRLVQGFTEGRAAVDKAIQVVTESQPMVLTSSHSLSVNILIDKQADADQVKAVSAAEKDLVAVTQTGVDVAGRHVDAKERSRAQTLMTALRDAQTILQEKRTQLNLAGLLALVKSQERMGDRKALIYFTANQQLTPTAKKMLETISAAAAQADVSVYTVDMDALGNSQQYQEANLLMNGQPPFNPAPIANSPVSTVPPMQQEGSAPISGTPSLTGPQWGPQQDIQVMTDFMRSSGEDRTNPFNDMKSPMAGFSKSTGGAYIDAQNSTRKPLEEMVQDLSTYYQASYVPPFKEYDGKFRTIAVKPMRAGLNVQTKTGYFAVAAGEGAGIQPFEAPMLKSLAAAELPTDVKFHAAVLRFGDLPDGNTSSLAVEVPLSELATRIDPQMNITTAHVAIVAQIKDESGVVVEHYSKDILKRGVAETLDRDHLAALSLERHFISTPGKYSMEAAVLDENSGKTGAMRADFEIAKQPGGVSLSDMVLVEKMEGSHVEDDDPLEPLRYEHQRVTPNLAGELRAHAKDVSLFFILHPDPTSSEPLTLELEMMHNGKAGQRTPLLKAGGMGASVPYLASIGSKSLPAGEYEMKAYLSQGGKSAEQTKSFRIEGTAGKENGDADSKWVEGAAITLDNGDAPVEATPHAPNELAITAPPKPIPPPALDEAHKLVEAARERALSYSNSLPNFMCTEETRRSVDANGDGRWKSIDTVVELLSFHERVEARSTLEVNGRTSDTSRAALKGAFSAGEFGGVLQAVFRPESKADFEWKETDELKGGTVQAYNYRVDPMNSVFRVTGSNGKEITVGFHGQVFIDSNNARARRITLAADSLPQDFPTHATSIAVDYDFVSIDGLKYLMPVGAELELKQGRRETLMNTMEFRDYKRFGGEVEKVGLSSRE